MTLETPTVLHAIESLTKAKSAAAAVTYLGDDLLLKQRRIDLKVFVKLQNGDSLDPQLALQFWMQKWAVWQLQQELMQQLKMGEAAGRVLAPMMNQQEGEDVEG